MPKAEKLKGNHTKWIFCGCKGKKVLHNYAVKKVLYRCCGCAQERQG